MSREGQPTAPSLVTACAGNCRRAGPVLRAAQVIIHMWGPIGKQLAPMTRIAFYSAASCSLVADRDMGTSDLDRWSEPCYNAAL